MPQPGKSTPQATSWRLTFYDSEGDRKASFEPTCNEVVIGRGTPDIVQLPSMTHEAGKEICAVEVDRTLFIGVPSNLISRRHFSITQSIEGTEMIYWVKDLDSGSGTYINGVQRGYREPCRLKTGDKIKFGHTTIVFRDLSLQRTVLEPIKIPKEKPKDTMTRRGGVTQFCYSRAADRPAGRVVFGSLRIGYAIVLNAIGFCLVVLFFVKLWEVLKFLFP